MLKNRLKIDGYNCDKRCYYSEVHCDEKLRIISISGRIDEALADSFFFYLRATFETRVSRRPITIYINSDGGDAFATFKIYDHIKSSPIPIITIVCGEAFSGGFIIFLAGDRRLVHSNAVLGFHAPTKFSQSDSGESPDEAVEATRHQKEILRKMVEVVRKNSNMDERLIRDHFRFTRRISAMTALKLGLAHEIIAPVEKNLPKNWGKR